MLTRKAEDAARRLIAMIKADLEGWDRSLEAADADKQGKVDNEHAAEAISTEILLRRLKEVNHGNW